MGAKAQAKISGQTSEELHRHSCTDTGAESSELPELMENQEHWKPIVDSARARSTE